MTLRITPELMRQVYDLLRSTRPFCRWELPSGEFVKFGIIRQPQTAGDYTRLPNGHRIRLSDKVIGRWDMLIPTMAHEMVHLKQAMIGKEPWHGAVFKRLASQVCKQHGFDPKAF